MEITVRFCLKYVHTVLLFRINSVWQAKTHGQCVIGTRTTSAFQEQPPGKWLIQTIERKTLFTQFNILQSKQIIVHLLIWLLLVIPLWVDITKSHELIKASKSLNIFRKS